MEQNGALSNPQVLLELESLTKRKVISEATSPMRAKDIHRACEDELGRPVAWSTVKTCLSDHSRGTRPRFERVAHGLYAPPAA
jgi:hypothetical protein